MLKRKFSEIFSKNTDEHNFCYSFSQPTTSYTVDGCCSNSNFNVYPCWLLRLPLEILEHIFTFLCPRSLMAMKSFNIERFDSAASKLKTLNFSLCNDVTPSEMTLLSTSIRMSYIKAINFNYVFRISSHDLMHFITKCKHLTFLSIIDCGITFQHVLTILDECKELQELFWNVNPSDPSFHHSLMKTCPYKLKKLHLCVSNASNVLDPAIYIINRSLPAEEILLNFSPSPFPLRSRQNATIYSLHMDLKCPVKIVLVHLNENVKELLKYIRKEVKCCCFDDEWFLSLTMTSPYFQLVARADYFSQLSSVADESVQSLVLYCPTDGLKDEVAPIKRVTGKALTYLCIKNMDFLTKLISISDLNNHNTMHYRVPHLIVDCHNIKDLILLDVHFDYVFNLEALCSLKALSTLFISACMLKDISSDKEYNLRNKFENFVKKSKGMRHFAIKGCNICLMGPRDKDIASISEWSELRTLSLVKVSTLQFCHFLHSVTDKCVHLRCAELQMIGSSLLYNYISSVAYMLRKSPQLVFLSTTLDSCHLLNKNFWSSIGLAKNLQGLCFIETSSPIQTHCKPIIDAIEKLKLLHLFHFTSCSRIENFEVRVRRAMKRNGVKNPKVKIIHSRGDCTPCDMPHFSIS